jgi:hypothetical protein
MLMGSFSRFAVRYTIKGTQLGNFNCDSKNDLPVNSNGLLYLFNGFQPSPAPAIKPMTLRQTSTATPSLTHLPQCNLLNN